MPVPTTEELLKSTRLWRSQTETHRCGLYLVYNRSERSFLPITEAGDVDASGWRFIANDHYTTWNQLTIEQQQALRDRAKVLVVMERLAGNEIP
jgi:hypothetical protein